MSDPVKSTFQDLVRASHARLEEAQRPRLAEDVDATTPDVVSMLLSTSPEIRISHTFGPNNNERAQAPAQPRNYDSMNEQSSLYEQSLDMEFPMNLDDSAQRYDYRGNGDLLEHQLMLMRTEFLGRCLAMYPPIDADITLSAFVTGQARAVNSAYPKATRLCFVTRIRSGQGHRPHEIHAMKLQMIQTYFPEQDFPELYPLILRYFMRSDGYISGYSQLPLLT